MKKNAFTLVELLAVIVILAVILVIAVPQVLDTITSSKQGSIDVSVKNIAKAAEMKYAEMVVAGESINGSINCSEVVNISTSDYSNCTVTFDENGKASVTVTGIGKFEGYTCINGTKEDSNCFNVTETKVLLNYINYLYNTASSENGLVKDDTEDQNIRYAGSDGDVKNYVSFDGDVWRIIGIVDGKVKLVKNDSIGTYSWDSSASDMNNGYGYNIWETIEGKTKGDGTTKADLNILLNDGFYGGTYPSECYGGQNNTTKACPTEYINSTLKSMIDDKAVWYLGGQGYSNPSTPPYGLPTLDSYNNERGTTIYSGHTDIAKTEWTGPVGLIYPSDYGYASTDSECRSDLRAGVTYIDGTWDYSNAKCKNNNWLHKSSYYWTMSPLSGSSNGVFNVYSSGNADDSIAYDAYGVVPALYLKSNILIESGDGSSSNPYILKAS